MKKRISLVLNFLAFNLLFFALYLNFIHKDSSQLKVVSPSNTIKGTVLVKNAEQYLPKQSIATIAAVN
jgi:hypothetical protein